MHGKYECAVWLNNSILYIHTWQHGQTKTAIFSITPKMFMLTFLQKSISLRTSRSETSCGVVTSTAPVKFAFDKYVEADRCSSEVPEHLNRK